MKPYNWEEIFYIKYICSYTRLLRIFISYLKALNWEETIYIKNSYFELYSLTKDYDF